MTKLRGRRRTEADDKRMRGRGTGKGPAEVRFSRAAPRPLLPLITCVVQVMEQVSAPEILKIKKQEVSRIKAV